MESRFFSQGLSDFLELEVYPTLFECLGVAFPEFGFRTRGDKWEATQDPQGPGAGRLSRMSTSSSYFYPHMSTSSSYFWFRAYFVTP